MCPTLSVLVNFLGIDLSTIVNLANLEEVRQEWNLVYDVPEKSSFLLFLM